MTALRTRIRLWATSFAFLTAVHVSAHAGSRQPADVVPRTDAFLTTSGEPHRQSLSAGSRARGHQLLLMAQTPLDNALQAIDRRARDDSNDSGPKLSDWDKRRPEWVANPPSKAQCDAMYAQRNRLGLSDTDVMDCRSAHISGERRRLGINDEKPESSGPGNKENENIEQRRRPTVTEEIENAAFDRQREINASRRRDTDQAQDAKSRFDAEMKELNQTRDAKQQYNQLTALLDGAEAHVNDEIEKLHDASQRDASRARDIERQLQEIRDGEGQRAGEERRSYGQRTANMEQELREIHAAQLQREAQARELAEQRNRIQEVRDAEDMSAAMMLLQGFASGFMNSYANSRSQRHTAPAPQPAVAPQRPIQGPIQAAPPAPYNPCPPSKGNSISEARKGC